MKHSHNYSWEPRRIECNEPHEGELMRTRYKVINAGTFDAGLDLHIEPGFGAFLKMDALESIELVYVQRGGKRIRVNITRHGTMSGPA